MTIVLSSFASTRTTSNIYNIIDFRSLFSFCTHQVIERFHWTVPTPAFRQQFYVFLSDASKSAMICRFADQRGGSSVIGGSIRYFSVSQISPQNEVSRPLWSIRTVVYSTSLGGVSADILRGAHWHQSLTVRVHMFEIKLPPWRSEGRIMFYVEYPSFSKRPFPPRLSCRQILASLL